MARDICYYDGACGMCSRSVRVLSRLDWLGTLGFQDMTAVPPSELPVDWSHAMRGMPMRTSDGRVLVGFPAVRRAFLRTPLGALVAWLFYLPGVAQLGAAAYRWVADHRKRGGACALDTRG